MASLAGVVSVTAGGVVSIVNVLAVLLPTLPAASDCVACTVYVPSAVSLQERPTSSHSSRWRCSVSCGEPETLVPRVYVDGDLLEASPAAVVADTREARHVVAGCAPAGWFADRDDRRRGIYGERACCALPEIPRRVALLCLCGVGGLSQRARGRD